MKTDDGLSLFLSSVFESPEFQKALDASVERALIKNSDRFPAPSKFLTREQASELLGVTPPTLDSLKRQGIIPSIRLGKCVRFNQQDVVNALSTYKRFERR